MKKCTTLFISNVNDVTTDYLISKFESSSDDYLRINSEDINSIAIEYNSKSGTIITRNDFSFDLSQVVSVYFRRAPTTFNSKDNVLDKPYLTNERRHFFEGLYMSLDKSKWINPIFNTYAGERKLMQLKLAQRLKLQIPETLVTNKLEKAKEFLKAHTHCIIKPISHGLQQRGKTFYSIYTTSIDLNKLEKLNLTDTFDTPMFLQKRIKNSKDIRVTIVGSKFFSVSIEKDSSQEVDWRKPEVAKIYKEHYLPNELEIKLAKINGYLGLVYSAIDLILTPEGEYVFLEINPVGEWGWLEKEVGLNISGSLINELLCR